MWLLSDGNCIGYELSLATQKSVTIKWLLLLTDVNRIYIYFVKKYHQQNLKLHFSYGFYIFWRSKSDKSNNLF